MIIDEFLSNYEGLTDSRKHVGLSRLFVELVSNHEEYKELIKEILHLCGEYEANDYFGTEGLDI